MNLRQIVTGFGFLAALGFATVANARSGYLTTFNSLYGTANTKLSSCDTCHPSGSKARNSYGADFEAGQLAGKTDMAALIAIQPIDSDGDSFTNLDEITALTFPGDAADKPGTPPPPTCADVDGDNYAVCDGVCVLAAGDSCGDCADAIASVNPGVTEICTDGTDNNCDGKIDSADAMCAAAAPSDYDIASVRATSGVAVGRKASLKVNVVQVVAGPATLVVQATEGGLTTTVGTVSLNAAGTYSFAYAATISGGAIGWTATIQDQDSDADAATAVTKVR